MIKLELSCSFCSILRKRVSVIECHYMFVLDPRLLQHTGSPLLTADNKQGTTKKDCECY